MTTSHTWEERWKKEFADNVVWWQECIAEMRIGDPDFKRLEAFIKEVEQEAFTRGKEEAEKAKNQAYWERNQLVAVLSKLFPAWIGYHKEADWEDDWRTIVYIKIPIREKVVSGDEHNHIPQKYWFKTQWKQLSWHIHDDDKKYFSHLEPGTEEWDGHTTEEKYNRLSAINLNKE